MIRAAIFDVGGVLVRTVDHSPRRNLELELGLAPGESETIVFNSLMGQKAQRGEVSDQDMWFWVGQSLNLGERLSYFRRQFWAGDQLDRELIAFIRTLGARYQTAIISNATDGLRAELEERFGIANAFDLIVCSAEEKIMKPNAEIYLRTLQRLGCQPEESIFIDDFSTNVAAANKLGMKTIHYEAGLNLQEELEKFDVRP